MRIVPAMVLITGALAFPGCGRKTESTPPFAETADVKQLMAAVIEPAADIYWDAVGWIVDENGEEYIRPMTPEEWLAVQNAAVLLAETGDLLIMDSRAQGRADWIAMAQALTQVSLRALDAARSEDPMAVFDVGGEVYAACTACHSVFAIETLRPSQGADSADAGGP